MAFVRSKTVEGRRYHQLVENYREGGKHRQRVLLYLGVHDTLEAAIEDAKRKLAAHSQKMADWDAEAETEADYAFLDADGILEVEEILNTIFETVYEGEFPLRGRAQTQEHLIDLGLRNLYLERRGSTYLFLSLAKHLAAFCKAHDQARKHGGRVYFYRERLQELRKYQRLFS